MKHGRSLVVLGAIAFGLMLSGSATAQEVAKPKVVPHDTQGREQCLMCHSGAMQGVPAPPEATHEGRENDMCLLCHSAESPLQSGTPPAIPHDTAGRDQCRMCHSGAMEGVPAPPASHEGIDVKYCQLCHHPAG